MDSLTEVRLGGRGRRVAGSRRAALGAVRAKTRTPIASCYHPESRVGACPPVPVLAIPAVARESSYISAISWSMGGGV